MVQLLPFAFAIALSPAIASWAARLAEEPGARYALAFPLLLFAAMRAAAPRPGSRRAGLLWLLAAVLVQVAAFAMGLEKAAALALPFGAIGYARASGRAPVLVGLLAGLAIPIPSSIASLVPLHILWSRLGEALFGAPPATLQISAWDSGFALMALMAGLSVYASARVGIPWATAAGRAARWAALAVPLQALAVVAAHALARAGAGVVARSLLTDGPWILLTLGTVVSVELRHRGEVTARVV